jgi:hypothetical protein
MKAARVVPDLPLDHARLSRLPAPEVERLARGLLEKEAWQVDTTLSTPTRLAFQRGTTRALLEVRAGGNWDVPIAAAQAVEVEADRLGAESAWLLTAGIFAPRAWDHCRGTRVSLVDRNLVLQWIRDRMPERAAETGREATITCNTCGSQDRVRFTVDGHGPLYCGRCYRRQRRARPGAAEQPTAAALDWAA